MIYQQNYELEDFMEEIEFGGLPKRCELCYRLRLTQTAQAAQKNGFEYFSTTLLISPHQKHEIFKKIGPKIGQEFGIKFYYEDFRPGFPESQKLIRQMNLYRQKYCGCIFSEKETFFKK
jgi:predicted adenine nucleotide alpha hydrolase (AANH) superfamily ATPase